MVMTSADLPPEDDEFEMAEISKLKSIDAKPPRIKEAHSHGRQIISPCRSWEHTW